MLAFTQWFIWAEHRMKCFLILKMLFFKTAKSCELPYCTTKQYFKNKVTKKVSFFVFSIKCYAFSSEYYYKGWKGGPHGLELIESLMIWGQGVLYLTYLAYFHLVFFAALKYPV